MLKLTLIVEEKYLKILKDLRIAWLVPSAASGAHWEPIWSEFLKNYPDSVFYTTSVWKEFDSTAIYATAVKIVGKFKPFFFPRKTVEYGYRNGLMYLPLNIVIYLWRSKPNIIISNAFSIWSIVAVILKPILNYKIIVLYEGSTPNSDSKGSNIRSYSRKAIAPFVDAFIANNKNANLYLKEYLKVDESKVFYRSYLVPKAERLLSEPSAYKELPIDLKRPTFIFIGQLLLRKGILQLLEACSLLRQEGYQNFSVLIIGDGPEYEVIRKHAKDLDVEECVLWMGRCSYSCLGYYLKQTDVFVFPSLEDTWGMVVLEAMAFGKPILCSKNAGAFEMVIEGENGYHFDPFEPQGFASLMKRFIEEPELISKMGEKSQQIIANYTPELVIEFLDQVIAQITFEQEKKVL